MIYVGIDVAKDKHDCFITNSDGEVLFKSFTISNNRDGFESLFQRIESVSDDLTKVKVGLEDTSYHNEELKSLTRYRFDKVKERAKLKTSVSRLINILFPELEKLVPTLHIASVYALLFEFPGASYVAAAHLARLANLLSESSKGHYNWARKDEKKCRHFFDYQKMKEMNEGKQMKDVWVGSLTKPSGKTEGKHPTQKPEYLLERIVLASTEEGQVILDPFYYVDFEKVHRNVDEIKIELNILNSLIDAGFEFT